MTQPADNEPRPVFDPDSELRPEHDPACSRCGGTGFLELTSTNGDFIDPCPGDDEIRDFDEDGPDSVTDGGEHRA